MAVPLFSQWRFQLAGLQIGRKVVGAGATADRSVNQAVRPGCLGLHSRRRDALTAAPQQDTAPLPNTIGEHLFANISAGCRADATHSRVPIPSRPWPRPQVMMSPSRVDVFSPSHYISQAPKCCAYRLRQHRQMWKWWWVQSANQGTSRGSVAEHRWGTSWVDLLLVVLGEAPVPYFTLRLQVLPARPLFLTFILNTLGETVDGAGIASASGAASNQNT
jgi:hypothetical protein